MVFRMLLMYGDIVWWNVLVFTLCTSNFELNKKTSHEITSTSLVTFWSTFSVEFLIVSVENNELLCNKRIRPTFPLIKPFLQRNWKGGGTIEVSTFLSLLKENSQHLLDGLENSINIKFALITKFPQELSDIPHFAIWTTFTGTNCGLLKHC